VPDPGGTSHCRNAHQVPRRGKVELASPKPEDLPKTGLGLFTPNP